MVRMRREWRLEASRGPKEDGEWPCEARLRVCMASRGQEGGLGGRVVGMAVTHGRITGITMTRGMQPRLRGSLARDSDGVAFLGPLDQDGLWKQAAGVTL